MSTDLEVALGALEALAARRGRPTRHDARPVLFGIGTCLLAEERVDAEAARGRILALPSEFRAAWEDAVRDELTMACTEHIRSVDPRYLDHPAYDFEYTVEARRLLEARLRAAELLGLHPDDASAAGIARADTRLQERLDRRGL